MPPKRRISRTSGRRSSNTMEDDEEEEEEVVLETTTMVVDRTPAKSSKKRKSNHKNDPDDEVSVGSRSSARLKRKRDATLSSLLNNNNHHASTILNFDTVVEDEEENHDHDDDPVAKRTKVDRSTEPTAIILQSAPTTEESLSPWRMESLVVVPPADVVGGGGVPPQQQHLPVGNDPVVTVATAPLETTTTPPRTTVNRTTTTTATPTTVPLPPKNDPPPPTVVAPDTVSTTNVAVVATAENEQVAEDPPVVANNDDHIFHRIQQVYPTIFAWYHTVVVPRWRQILLLDPATTHDDDHVTTTTGHGKYHQSTLFWCGILLVLQMVAYPIWIHPILSTTVALSRVLVSMYDQVVVVQGGRGGRSFDAQTALQTVQQLQVALQSLTQQEQSRHDELLHWTTALTMDDDDDTTTTDMAHLIHQYEEMIQSRIAELSNTIQQLESFDPKQNQSTALELISDRSTNIFLLDLTRSDFLDDMTKNRTSTSAANCDNDHPISNGDTAPLQHSEMEQAVLDLQREIHEIINTTIMTSASTMEEIRQWIQLEVEQQRATPSHAVVDRPNDHDNNIARTIVTQQIRMKQQQQQLSGTDVDENETKIIDYASVVQGGTILYATPSLMQTLPILNRILARLQWRFYGHSADMILTPKITTRRDPTNRNPVTLGQCWSFPRTKAAVVVIQLGGDGAFGAGIDVSSVAVEHPFVSSDRDTAIQTFHVSGSATASSSYHHPDQNDENNEWFDLGTFEYDGSKSIPGTNGLVEFPISIATTATTTTIPPLRIIRLQIDPIGNDTTPNQKYSYSCLYRFRVNGRPASLE